MMMMMMMMILFCCNLSNSDYLHELLDWLRVLSVFVREMGIYQTKIKLSQFF